MSQVKEAYDLLRRESELKKQGQKSDDKQAIELLELALKQLREREKQKVPAERPKK